MSIFSRNKHPRVQDWKQWLKTASEEELSEERTRLREGRKKYKELMLDIQKEVENRQEPVDPGQVVNL